MKPLTAANLIQTLAERVGAEQVLTASDAMAAYLGDWRGRYHGAAICVVRPGTTAEVSAVVADCAAAGVPMVPQGGNTSLCGAATPAAEGRSVLISLARLKRVRAIDPANNTITVEAGCVLQALQEAAAQAGRLLPLSLAAEGSCQIGGNLSTNAGGVQVLRYGNARELTLGLEVVLPSGEVWDGLRGLRKDNTGYDLKQLFIGAEGTLGIITAAVLKLFPLPRTRSTAWLAIASPAVAVHLLADLQARFGALLTACELVSEVALGLVRKHLPGSQPTVPASPWHLLVEVSGGDEQSAGQQALEGFLAEALASGTIDDAVVAQSSDQARRLWAMRENIGEAQKLEGLSVKHDVSLPISRIAEFVDRAGQQLALAFPEIRIVAFGHVGDGNLHYNQSKAAAGENAAFIAAQPAVNRIVYDLVHELGGSISAEHGIGQLKREELRRYKSPLEIEMMRAIKRTLDPQGLMNPGKVL
ncbi:MAG: FAD-binding oxidoreductase [Candidatus Accumulibacter sp.]|uniref:FAD-binding oxidoreductase n=1 Tax=Accumulibacter sp. TaxID=2053492 RepID=UPI0025EB1F1B|nr:FAD-binding oxidoreductase [Accumulibacter sp.]MCP5246940.1 FAD-binding oxidoreductase [Accumulibacter sp.]